MGTMSSLVLIHLLFVHVVSSCKAETDDQLHAESDISL
jgi:hypothetical protein